MIRKLLFLCFFVSLFSFGQFNQSAPWMENLETKKSTIKKTSIQQSSNGPYSIYEISDAFQRYWEGKDSNKKGSGFKPYMRWENYWMNFVDSYGNLPSSKTLLESWKNKRTNSAISNPISNWIPIGPSEPGTLGSSLPGTGRVNAIAVDPNNSNIWYAGAPAGGIWKSINAGGSWVNLFDDFLQIGVSGIAIDPNNSNIIYIATGDDDAADSYSVGVFKSIDAGQTWTETGLGPSSDSNWGNNRLMSEITIDPTNSNVIWVATSVGLYKSIDAGVTWDRKRAGNIKDFRLKPNDPNTIYAITSSQYYKSIDGENFTQITDILPTSSGRLVLDVSPADPNVLYILSANTASADFSYQGLYKSIDSGETFVESPNATNIMESSQAWFDLALAVSPFNAEEIYMGCLNIWGSSNGGNSFTRLNQWNVNNEAYSHADIHTLKFFGETLFAATDGGLYISNDDGATFQDKTGNMAITQFYRISVSKQNSNRIAGGTQDNAGYISNENNWNVYTGGDGMDYEIDPGNQNVIYGFSQFGSPLWITTNAGQTVGAIGAPRDANNQPIQGNWITPLALSGNGEIYAGYDALYKLNGNSWEKISSSIGTSNIDDLEIDQNDSSIIFIAESNFLYQSKNGGQTFVPVHGFGSDISSFDLNYSNSNIIYVTTSNRVGTSQSGQPAERGVFKVTITENDVIVDDITLNLPTDQAFFSIAAQGRNTDNPVYVGTSLGVYRIDDTLTEWEEYFTGLPNVAVGDLEISLNEGIITAATYGRGVWQSPIPIQIPDNDVSILSLSPEPFSVLCGEITPEIIVENTGANPITTIDITFNINGGPDNTFVENVTLNNGESTSIALPPQTFGTIGKIELTASATVAGDAYNDNNNLSSTFFANSFGTGDVVNDFETEGLVTFNVGGDDSVWERGTPQGILLNEAASGTQVYATNLTGNHPDGTLGVLVSNCYEFSSILAPVLKFTMAYDLEPNFDIVYVEYSTDDGSVWNLLGNINSQPNWYNSDRTNESSGEDDDCQNCPGGQWTGTNATLTEYSYDFTANAANGEIDLTNESSILFRIVFQSDPSVNQEGVVIDDFVVEGFQDDDDDDNDGILDVDDNCPLLGNADQLDTDNDGIGDLCDLDDDNDGILDVEDNCPLIPNVNQEDSDSDGIGNLCDNDNDNDGVPNDLDLCQNTPEGAVVDVTGCEVFSLPANNFRVLSVGESCISSNDGRIEITAETRLSYTAVLDGNGINESKSFDESTIFENLQSGTYTICITVEGESAYQNCIEVNVAEPESLSVNSKINSLKSEVTLNLSGGKSYFITLNKSIYQTSESEITLPLSNVENILVIRTDKDCQGIYEENILLNKDIFIYPNPITNGDMTVLIGKTSSEKVQLSLFTIDGAKVFNKQYLIDNGKITFNVDALSKGIYILNVKTENTLFNYKIIRK